MPTEKAHGIQMIKMSEAFASLGVDLEFIVPKRKNVIEEDVFSYYGVRDIFKIRKIFCLDFIEKWASFGYWLQSFTFLISAVSAFIFLSRKDKLIYTREYLIAFIFHLLGFDTVYEAHRILLKKKTFFYLVKNIPYIITNSEGTAEEFINRGFKKVLPLPNGVDLDEFKFKISKEELKNRFSIPQYKKVVLYTGNFYDWKGTETLIEAAALLQEKDIIVVFVGGREGEVVSKRKEIEDRGLTNILFLGHKNRKEIPYILKSADVLVLPNSPVSEESIKYTSPVKLGEYMASGVPIAASDLPSIRAIVSEKAAVFFTPDDAKGLRNAILKLLDDEEFATDLSSNALGEVEKYTWETRAEKILKFISF
jgi:glycosyltransferase involved in cell wall biosynthesis